MDKTITRAPTWTGFLIHAARMRAPWRLALLPVAGLATIAYLAKLIDRARLKEWTQRLMLGRTIAPEALGPLAESFAERVVATGTFAHARARIAQDHAEGWRIVLATASYGFYARAIARRVGIEDVIATNARIDDRGHIVSRIEGENCYGAAKLRKIREWMAREGIARDEARVRFYSDHVSDAPVLEWADEPFAVNAHGPLRRLARARGWPALDWEA